MKNRDADKRHDVEFARVLDAVRSA